MRSASLRAPLLLLLLVLFPLVGCGGGQEEDTCAGHLGALPGPTIEAGPLAGSFARVTDVEALLAQADLPAPMGPAAQTSVLAGDLDGDGRADILYNLDASGMPAGSWVLLQDDKGGFTPLGHPPGGIGACHFLADMDGDGARDLVCTQPAPLTIVWGTPMGLDWTHPTTAEMGGAVIGSAMAVAPMDLDEDGWLDVVVSLYGAPNLVFWNQGRRAFAEVGARWALDNPGLTWAVASLDADGDGHADVYTMNDGIHNDTDANTLLRAAGPGPDGEPRFERVQPMVASCDAHGFFQKGLATPMGLALGDLDGDGHPEMYLALSSNDPVLTRGSGSTWADARSTLTLAEPTTSTGQNLVRWSPAIWDADHDGLLDILLGGGDDLGHGSKPGRGSSHLVFYRGLASDRFEEAHAAVGLGAEGQFFSAVRADLDGDLELDLLIGGFGQLPRVYANRLVAAGEHFLLELSGTLSNPHGLGARVEVEAGGHRRVYVMGERFGPRLGEAPLLDIGLGSSHQADTVVVTWPSGHVQRVSALASGQRHVIVEPGLVQITPASRHAPADGASEVVIEVQPTGDDGEPRPDAVVHIDAPFQAATFAGPEAPAPGGGVMRTLRAPSAPGSVVIEVRVDGRPLLVRPRIWFD